MILLPAESIKTLAAMIGDDSAIENPIVELIEHDEPTCHPSVKAIIYGWSKVLVLVDAAASTWEWR